MSAPRKTFEEQMTEYRKALAEVPAPSWPKVGGWGRHTGKGGGGSAVGIASRTEGPDPAGQGAPRQRSEIAILQAAGAEPGKSLPSRATFHPLSRRVSVQCARCGPVFLRGSPAPGLLLLRGHAHCSFNPLPRPSPHPALPRDPMPLSIAPAL